MKKLLPIIFALFLAGCQLFPAPAPSSIKLSDPKVSIITPSPTIINTPELTPTTMSTPSAKITEATAIIKTSKGDITIELFPKSAPKTVTNFIGLSKGTIDWTNPKTGQKISGKPLYEGTIFHRVIKDFMIQGGDPLGTGTGDPGYRFADEFDPSLNFSEPYMLAMANSGPNTNGSQFFITVVSTTWLNNKHTIFGKVASGMDIVTKIENTPVGENDKPATPVTIESISIERK